jgi:hypothetical protein
MPNIHDLYAQADLISKEIDKELDNYHLEKKKLVLIEDSLVFNRERLRSVKETIRLQENSCDFSSMTDESREAEIVAFKKKLSLTPLK